MISIGIVGYGNLGRGLEKALAYNPDLVLKAIFTRRDPSTIHPLTDVPVVSLTDAPDYQNQIDVMILCGGSSVDLPIQGPQLAQWFNTIDSFDNHNHIPAYFEKVDQSASNSGHLSLISAGWDPGLFSLVRALFGSVLPNGKDFTFWGKGVSQGHSDAIRQIPGVIDARQYTMPIEAALEAVRSGASVSLTTREKHWRDCYAVVESGADQEAVRKAIVSMPDYFEPYDTRVTFLSAEELANQHKGLPHGGFVIRSGETSEGTYQTAEFSLHLDSNPEFTASVLAACARAVYRMKLRGRVGAISIFDIAIGDLSPKSPEAMRHDLL
jgi:diaminopimelate dehydrogenase